MKSMHKALMCCLLPLWVAGCGKNTNTQGADLAGTDPGRDLSGTTQDLLGTGGDMGTGGDLGPNPGELTLANCTTNIAAAAPAFYKNYFSCVTITMNGTSVVISSNSLPPHRSYYYGSGNPNFIAFDTRGGVYHANPNSLKSTAASVTIPAAPVSRGLTINATLVDGMAQTSTNEYPLGPAGVALDSVHLYNDLAAPGMTIDAEKFTFDPYSGHPAPSGDYHYHTTTPGPLEALQHKGLVTKTAPGTAEIEVYGMMCDGTLVLGCTELDGSTPGGTFDAQNGHLGDLKDKGGVTHFTNRYHTHVCPGKIGTHQYTPEIQYYTTCTR